MTAPTAVATRTRVAVVPHTHWDREWYLPFERFRMRLVRLVDHLIALFAADPAYSHFMLDGQSIVLEDYLAVRPERQEALEALIRSGRVAVGPWYVLPDSFLVSGEALVRNLAIGQAIARRHGGSMALGYLPDSFGHVAQMPQVFAGFGFTTGCLWRGVGDDVPGLEWRWEALDGTGLYLQWLSGGYGNFANLPANPEPALRRIEDEVARLAPLSRSRTLLLMNGSDHLMPQAFLPALLEGFRGRHPEWELVQEPLAGVLERARTEAEAAGPLPVVRGELRSAAKSHLLPGVLSARIPQKARNVVAQRLLERWVEPLGALAQLAGRPYPAPLATLTWKRLLQNHPHDSICGCSVDEVHTEIEGRFDQVEQLGGALLQESLAVLAAEDPDDPEVVRQGGIRLWNPHPWEVTGLAEAQLSLDRPEDGPLAFHLRDVGGAVVPHEVIAETPAVRVINRSPLYPLNVPCAHLTVRVVATLPPLGRRTLRVVRGAAPIEGSRPAEAAVENADFRVVPVPGGIEILDKALAERVIHRFEDQGDRGDEYNFCPVEGEVPRTSQFTWTGVRSLEGSGFRRLELEGAWDLPDALAEDRRSRGSTRALPIRLDVTLVEGVRRVDLALTVDHRHADHRLRASFRLPGAIAATTADTAFGWVTRPTGVQPRNWDEAPVGTHPMTSQTHVDRPGGRVGVAGVGLHEVEAEGDALLLTLLRAVGWLSRDDLSTRKGDAGPMLPTPGAQLPGTWTFRYAWSSQGADEPEGTLARRLEAFVVPPQGFPVASETATPDAWHLALTNPAWRFSALKPADDGDGLVLRVFNGSERAQEGAIALGFPVARARHARIDETPLGEAPVRDGRIALTLRPFEIATLRLSP